MFIKNQRGMTLIEVMVAILLLGITTVSLTNLFLAGNTFTAIARHDVTALNLAQEVMEEIKSIPDNQIGTAQGGTNNTITLEDKASNNDDYYNDYMIATTGGTGAGQIRKITDYNGSDRIATVDPEWTTGLVPDNTTTYLIYQNDVDQDQYDFYDFKIAVAENDQNLKTVTVAVYYQDKDREREVSLITEKLKR